MTSQDIMLCSRRGGNGVVEGEGEEGWEGEGGGERVKLLIFTIHINSINAVN